MNSMTVLNIAALESGIRVEGVADTDKSGTSIAFSSM